MVYVKKYLKWIIEDRYLVSRNAEIFNIIRQTLLPLFLINGYPSLSLYNGVKKTFYIHILVASAFYFAKVII